MKVKQCTKEQAEFTGKEWSDWYEQKPRYNAKRITLYYRRDEAGIEAEPHLDTAWLTVHVGPGHNHHIAPI